VSAAKAKHGDETLALLKQPVDEEGALKPVSAVPNFLEEASLFESAGYGFGPKNYTVGCSLRRLASSVEGLKKIRLWGKILGSGKDYFVAEGVLDGLGEATDDPLFEPQGTGVNSCSYWVTTDLSEWEKLPDVEPHHIVASRKIQFMCTGDLNAKIWSAPAFLGKERNYLRALIARISADTVLTIAGFLEKNEEGNGAREAENFEFPHPSLLKDASRWGHCVDYVLRNGRTTYPEVTEEGEDAEAKKKERAREVALDPPQDSLRGIKAELYALKLSQCQTIAQAHSLKWPGAITCLRGTTFANLYVGYGLQFAAKTYTPSGPGGVEDEPTEGTEQEEPQGRVDEPPAAEES